MTFELYNGVQIPSVVFGTDIVGDWRLCNSILFRQYEKVKYRKRLLHNRDFRRFKLDINIESIIETAIENGVLGFDTSRAYGGSEAALGRVISKYERNRFFLISKVSNLDQRSIGAAAALERSLNDLKTDYIDLYLLHWPQPDTFMENWYQLEDVYLNTNKCRAIGVCNCKEHHISKIIKEAKIKPMVNEIELHPLLIESKLFSYCTNLGIRTMAYTSTARMDDRLIKSPRLIRICEKYNKSPAQIILKWHIQNGRVPIFNTSNKNHLVNNISKLDFEMDSLDLATIDGMNINSRLRYDSDNCDYEIL